MSAYIEKGFSNLVAPEYLKTDNDRFEFMHGTVLGVLNALPGDYVHDRATDLFYKAHSPFEIQCNLPSISIAYLCVASGTIAFDVATVIVCFAKLFFAMLTLKGKEILKERFTEFKSEIYGVFKGLQCAIGIESALLYGLVNFRNEIALNKIKVIIGNIEYSWNREKKIEEDFFSKFCCYLQKISGNESETDIDSIRKVFTRVIYVLREFQPVGKYKTLDFASNMKEPSYKSYNTLLDALKEAGSTAEVV